MAVLLKQYYNKTPNHKHVKKIKLLGLFDKNEVLQCRKYFSSLDQIRKCSMPNKKKFAFRFHKRLPTINHMY